MAYVSSYSHYTAGSVPVGSWEQAYHTAASWKSYLQSFPGMLNVRISARPLDNGDVRLHLVTIWEHLEQLTAWAESPYSGEKLLLGLDVPAYEVVAEVYEDLS
jgi:heme-degrading monooxygenase HmoA